MGQVLYRKYRPKSLDQVVGQEHIAAALQQAIKRDRLSHAYLFTGPRGVGKTSVARILAHAINRLPYEDESLHLDIIEIDAASNRRIDEIRDLRDRLHVAPTSARYKVYIIDEVHMLTREAMSALLKTLEEPPAHVVFILATTETHKLPATIISRTQRFSFKPIETAKMVAHLQTIAAAEQIVIDEAALALIAAHGEGSFRDSIGLLDQVRNVATKIGAKEVLALTGQVPAALLDDLLAALDGRQPSAIVPAVQRLVDQGYEPARIARQLGERLRADVVAPQPQFPLAVQLHLLAQLINVPVSPEPGIALEIALLSIAADSPSGADAQPPVAAEQQPSAPSTAKRSAHNATAAAPPPASAKKPAKPAGDAPLDDTLWPQILEAIKREHNTLYGIARMGHPVFSDNQLIITFRFQFHQKRMNDARHRQILAETIQALTGRTVAIDCVVQTEPFDEAPAATSRTPETPASGDEDNLAAISNIFGGGELLES